MFSDTNKLFTNTYPINRRKSIEAVKAFYRVCKRPEPKIRFVQGPKELEWAIQDMGPDAPFFTAEKECTLAHFVTKRGVSGRERVQSAVKQIIEEAVPGKRKWFDYTPVCVAIDHLYHDKDDDSLNKTHFESPHYEWHRAASAVWDEAYALVTYEDVCFVVDRPLTADVNERGFHNPKDSALFFNDHSEYYFYEGVRVTKEQLLNPGSMTLEDIHGHRSNKHIMIDLMGVDRYLELVDQFKIDVKDRFQKFFAFPEMIVEGDEGKESWNKKGRGHHYKDKAYEVEFCNRDVNGEYALCMDTWGSQYVFWGDPLKSEAISHLLDEEDHELWKHLNIKEMMSRGAFHLHLTYQDGKFSLWTKREEGGSWGCCRHDVVPAWFRTKMFRKQDAFYETDKLKVRYTATDGKWEIDGVEAIIKHMHDSLFSGNEQVPDYHFDINLSSDSWEGLLRQWADLAFEWIWMH